VAIEKYERRKKVEQKIFEFLYQEKIKITKLSYVNCTENKAIILYFVNREAAITSTKGDSIFQSLSRTQRLLLP